MPQFILNMPEAAHPSPSRKVHPFYGLNDFAKGYVEAMFFTNGDTGDEREHLLNEWGVGRLTHEAVRNIADQCAEFHDCNRPLLEQAYGRGYTAEQAGRDFWFSRQRHGAGFWDRKELEAGGLGDRLHNAAKCVGEAYCAAYRGWIYHR